MRIARVGVARTGGISVEAARRAQRRESELFSLDAVDPAKRFC
ncbi:MAG TPA: hypothetical protein VMF89_15705 [Polyangiales bacterium]|nr:hypothetical protein [Polyangiales bacterium]